MGAGDGDGVVGGEGGEGGYTQINATELNYYFIKIFCVCGSATDVVCCVLFNGFGGMEMEMSRERCE